MLLLNDGDEGLGSEAKGRELAQAIRRLEPTAKYSREINEQLAVRRRNLARVVHNFSLLTDELGQRDTQLANFVQNSNAVFDTLASQDVALRQTLQKLPGTLQTTQETLGKVDTFAQVLGPTLESLRPAARALGPSLRQTRPFLRESTPIIRDEIRPFTRAALPTVQELRPAMRDLAAVTPDLTASFSVLNRLLNTIAYNPPGDHEEGFLFWQSWVNHAGNAIFSTADAHGPIRRGLVVLSCSSAQLLDAVAAANPQLGTIIGLLNAPSAGSRSARSRRRRPGAEAPVVKDAPSFGKIAAMVLFALSCFGLLLFLWLAFGGPVPLKPKGYRFHTSFFEANQLALEADVRISGVPVGKVKKITPDKSHGPLGRRDPAALALRAAAVGRARDPAPEDAAGRDLRGADAGPQLGRADPRGRRAGRLAGLRHRRARRDPARVRPRDACGLPGLDADAGDRDLQPRARPQRRARQPRAVRRGHGRPRRDPQPPGGRALAPGGQHGRRLRRADRARHAAALADREHQLGVLDDRLAGRRAAGRVPRAADVRARVAS